MWIESESTPCRILTAEVIRQQLLANIKKFDLKQVNHDPIKSFVYYYDLLNTEHVLRRLFAEYYPKKAADTPNFLVNIFESDTKYELAEYVLAGWLAITPSQIAEIPQRSAETISLGLVTSYPVPITRAAAYHAGFKLWTRDDFIPEEYKDSVKEQALDIVMEIFMGSLELTRKQLQSRGMIALALRKQVRVEHQSADME
jgi:hypothetical protein